MYMTLMSTINECYEVESNADTRDLGERELLLSLFLLLMLIPMLLLLLMLWL
jgi:uncharacterized BrkB/YihY/UPF0761 family membrane protein